MRNRASTIEVGPQATILSAHLRENAGRYIAGATAPLARASLVRVDRRRLSWLYTFDLSVGERHEVMLVKVPIVDAEVVRAQAVRDRPRVASVPHPETKAALEHAALRAIHEHFTRLADPRLGAVRVFDYLPEQGAVVMQYVGDPSLRRLVLHAWHAGWRGPMPTLGTVFANVGAWLRNYHALPGQPHVRQRHVDRAGFVEHIAQVTSFLGGALRARPYFTQIAGSVDALASAVLPDALPLGRSHGDFAMRNVLVAPDARVTVLDTLGRFSTAIYEDLGYFLADLKCNPVHGVGWMTHVGRRRIAAFERAFLSGYFEDRAVPTREVALYEVAAILDRWSSLTLRRSQAAGARERLIRTAHVRVMSRLFRSLLHERLHVAAGGDGGPDTPWS